MDRRAYSIYVVQLFEHHGSHFKLGYTERSAQARSKELPEKDSLDPNKCFAWRMMTYELARSIERALHAMLYCLEYHRPRAHRKAGYTEWYAPEALAYVENFMNNIRGTWFERVPFMGGGSTQMRSLLDGLRLALDAGVIEVELFDGVFFYTRIDASASGVIEMLKGRHSTPTDGNGALEIIDCFEPLNGADDFYAALLRPRMPNNLPVNLELLQLCEAIPSYTGDDPYFTVGLDEDG